LGGKVYFDRKGLDKNGKGKGLGDYKERAEEKKRKTLNLKKGC